MFARLLLLFTVVPLVELFLLLRIGGAIGPLPTLGIVVVTGVVGSTMARAQGVRVIREAQAQMNRGEMPSRGILEGILVFSAGLLLVTPGVLTDVVGFALLVPKVRALVASRVGRAIRERFVVTTFQSTSFQERFGMDDRGRPLDADVIDIEPSDEGEGGEPDPRDLNDRE
jgi:UPF0716 protein FxsA